MLGGDFYDAVRDPDGTVHAIIGDVAGHGPDEAALGALLRVSWRALVLAGVAEERVLPELQRLLVSERHDQRLFTTACTITITGEARHRAARRPSAAGGAVVATMLAAPVGLPLGVDPGRRVGAACRSRCRPIGRCCSTPTASSRPASPPTGDFLWIDGLLELLPTERATLPAELPARLVERAEAYNGGPLLDDVAILAAGRPLMHPDPEKRWTLKRIFAFGAAAAGLITVGADGARRRGAAAAVRHALGPAGPGRPGRALAAQNLTADLIDQETGGARLRARGGQARRSSTPTRRAWPPEDAT